MSDTPKKADSVAMQALLDLLANTLTTKIKSGEVDAATLNVARQLLKDNKVEMVRVKGNAMDQLGGAVERLPFPDGDEEPDLSASKH